MMKLEIMTEMVPLLGFAGLPVRYEIERHRGEGASTPGHADHAGSSRMLG